MGRCPGDSPPDLFGKRHRTGNFGDFGSSPVAFELRAHEYPIVGVGAQWIWTGIWVAFSAIVITVAYCDLRVIKERADIDQITAVFD